MNLPCLLSKFLDTVAVGVEQVVWVVMVEAEEELMIVGAAVPAGMAHDDMTTGWGATTGRLPLAMGIRA